MVTKKQEQKYTFVGFIGYDELKKISQKSLEKYDKITKNNCVIEIYKINKKDKK